MKKTYIQPACKVMETEFESCLLQASEVQGNAGLDLGGSDSGYEGEGRARQVVGVDWDDWE
jgi:hypothetical protein